MARKKRGRRGFGKKNRAIPLAIVGPLAMPAVQYVAPKLLAGDLKGAFQSMVLEYTGMGTDSKFHPNQLVEAYLPVLGGVVVHKLATKFGVNKYARKFTMGMLEL